MELVDFNEVYVTGGGAKTETKKKRSRRGAGTTTKSVRPLQIIQRPHQKMQQTIQKHKLQKTFCFHGFIKGSEFRSHVLLSLPLFIYFHV